jgi:uncharacterized Ntn-hydrolase superfamily protein
VQAIVNAFESSTGPLAERMLAALDAGQAAGGDARGMQAAAIVVAKPLAGSAGFGDRVIDLRVDDSRTPLVELRRLLNLFRSRQLVADANARLQEKKLPAAAEAALAANKQLRDAWRTRAEIEANLEARTVFSANGTVVTTRTTPQVMGRFGVK